MTAQRPQQLLVLAVAALGVALLAVLAVLVSYRVSPLVTLALPLVLAVAAGVALSPQLGVCLGIAVIPLEVVSTSAGSFRLSPMEAMFALTAAVVLMRAAGGLERLRWPAVLIVFGVGLLWMVMGLAVARDSFVVVRTTLMWAAFGLVALWVANSGPRQVRQVLWAIVGAGAAMAVVAILNGSALEARNGASVVAGRATGSFTHPNQLAFFLVMALPIALVVAARGRPRPRALAAAAAVAMFVALMLTLTRGAIIGAAVSLAVLLLWPPFRRLAGGVLIALALFAAFNAESLSSSKEVNLVGDRLATLRNRDEANIGNGRLVIWSTVPQMVADHPVLGLGVGNFSQHSLEYDLSEGGAAFYHAHNVALTVAAEQGLPGLALLLATIFLVVGVAARALRARGSPGFPYALALVAGLCALAVNSVTDYPPGSNPNMALLLIEVGALVAFARALAPSTERTAERNAA